MHLATTHFEPLVAVGLASVIILAMAWYWPRLSRPEMPVTRRRIRRASLLIGLLGLIAATLGFGIIDPDARPMPYFAAWGAASLAIFVVVMLALLDALVSLRMHRTAMTSMRRERAATLGKAIDEAKARRSKESP